MNSQKREEWVTKGEEKSANNVELEPTKDNIQQAVKKIEGNNSQSSPTKGLTPQGSNTKSDDHKQGREPTRTDDKCTSEKIPQTKPTNTPKLEGCISTSTNGCGTHEPLNKKGYSATSSETHPTEAQKSRLSNSAISRNQEGKLTGYQFYKANLKENIAKFESNPDQYRPEPNYESCVPKTNGRNDYEKEPKANRDAHLQTPKPSDGGISISKGIFIVEHKFPLPPSEESDSESSIQQGNKEHSFKKDSGQEARSRGHMRHVNNKEISDASSENAQNSDNSTVKSRQETDDRLDNRKDSIDNFRNSQISRQNSSAETKTKVEEIVTSSEPTGSETRLQPQLHSLKSNKNGPDNNKQNNVSGQKRYKNTRQVSPIVNGKELHEIIPSERRQKVAPRSLPVDDVGNSQIREQRSESDTATNVLGHKRYQNTHHVSPIVEEKKIPERISNEPRPKDEPHSVSLPVDDVGNSQDRGQNSDSDGATKREVCETEPSLTSILSETRRQPKTTLKSNTDRDVNQPKGRQNNISGDQINGQVATTVDEKKVKERIPRKPRQKFELKSTPVPETIGIQGFNNSCYMDSSLVSLFLYDTNKSFSKFIQQERRTTGNDKHVLKGEIRAEFNNLITLLLNDSINLTSARNKFRGKMSEIHGSYSGDEKDVEEFMSTLFGPVLGCSPFYRIAGDTGEDDGGYVFQTYGLPDIQHLGNFPGVQDLVNHSFNDSDIQLKEVPRPGFIIKLPVTNGRHMFPKVFPNMKLSLEKIVEDNQNTEMLLSAVICLRSNHYTAFVRMDQDDINSSWAYLDSFQHSEYTLISNLCELLQDQSHKYIINERNELLKLLFENPYICVYSHPPAK